MNRKRQKFAEHGGQARVLAFVAFKVVRPLIWLLLAAASVVIAPIQQFAYAQSLTQVLNTGFSPASMNTSNLPQSRVIFYDKNFVKNLKANTPFVRCSNRRELPENSGNQLQLFMYNVLGANIAQTSEGTVGSGITVSVVNNVATIGQYADYVNLSDIALQTALDPALENIQKELAYRLGLALSTLVRNTLDGANAIDSSVSGGSLAYNVAFTKSNITSAVQSLAGRNVMPFDQGHMCGVVHPFIVGDALNDTSNNSLTDVLKRTVEGQGKLSELPSPDGDEVPVLEWAGVRFYQSTIVTQTLNYQAQSGKTALRTYIIGENGVITISLGKKENSMIGNGDWRNLKLWMYKTSEPTPSDPARVIGGWTSYNVKFVPTLVPDTTQRSRYIDAVASTVS